jgi:hypothetical protein
MLLGAWLAAGRLRGTPGTLMAVGCAIAAAGMLILTGLRPGSEYLLVIAPATAVFGVGRAVAYTPAMSLATHEVAPGDIGAASGLINASQQVGGAIGTALLNTVAATAAAAWLRAHPGGPGARSAAAYGYATGARWATGILLLAAALAYLLNRPPGPRRHNHRIRLFRTDHPGSPAPGSCPGRARPRCAAGPNNRNLRSFNCGE